MRIKKIAPETPANGNIENTYGTSQENTYSQEYINKFTDYSTTEQVVGKWVNGKPIYRKVIDISNITSSNSNLVDITSLKVEQMIKIGGFVKYDNNTFPIPLTDSSTNYNVLFYNGQFLRGRLVMGTGGNLQSAYAIIEYTKTTD